MPPLFVVLAVLFLVGAAGVAYAILAPRKRPAAPTIIDLLTEDSAAPEPAPVAERGAWTSEAGAEFAGLTEAARCDLIFAVSAFDDERSHLLLAHALDDSSQTVALAAAHALARHGRIEVVRSYAQAHDGPRSAQLLQLLSLLA